MAYGLGSRSSNRALMAVYAVAAVAWTVWRLFDYGKSSDVQVAVAPRPGNPSVELYGGRLQPGNVVELSVAKVDVERLIGMIDLFRYSEIVVTLVLLLVAMTFLYRFCDRVIDGRAFDRGASVDLAVVAVCIALLPFVGGMLRQMGTNAVVGALDLPDVVDTARSFTGMWVAIIAALFLQFVYATVQQGAVLAEDTKGLV